MRVLIVDDHQVVRRGVRTFLEATADVEICGEAVDGLDAIVKAQDLQPDAVVMDVSMPNLNGLEATREIVRLLPETQIIVLSQYDAPEMMRQAFKAGARGYVIKSAVTTDLLPALQKIMRREQSFPSAVLGKSDENVDIQEILRRSSNFETALRETEDRLRRLVEYQSAIMNNMAEGLYTVDENGLLTSMNRAGEEILGWSKEELLGKKMHDVTHFKYPDGRPFPAAECSGLQVLQKGIAIREHEDVFIRKDGASVPVIYSASPLLEDGKIRGVVVGFRDDTEPRLAREALLQATRELELGNEHLRLITDRMAASVTRCSRDLKYLWANQNYANWLQQPLDQIIGHRIEDVLGSDAIVKLRPFFDRVLSGQKVSYDEEIPFRGIGRRWITAAYTPTFNPEGVVDGWVAAIWDTTERKQAEDALRNSQALYAAEAEALARLNARSSRLWQARELHEGLQEMLHAVIELLGAQKGNVQLLNSERSVLTIEAQSGFEREFLDFFREGSADDGTASGRALRTGEPIVIEDVEQDAEYAPYRIIARRAGYRAVVSVPMITRDGRPLGILSTNFASPHRPTNHELRRFELYARQASDFVERCHMEAMLQGARASRAEQEWTGRLLEAQDEERRRIARELHDGIGQLLAAISMNAAQVRREKLNRDDAARIEENVGLIRQAVTEIRDLSHLLHPPLLDEVGLGSAVKLYVDGFAKRSKICVRLDIDPTLCRMPQQHELALFRALQECLTNIHRHSGSTKAQVRLYGTTEGALLDVRDEGRGMKREILSRSRSGDGEGLGLRGMKERITSLGGTVEIQSNKSGTAIRVTVPTSRSAAVAS